PRLRARQQSLPGAPGARAPADAQTQRQRRQPRRGAALAGVRVTAHLAALGDWVAGLHIADVPAATLQAARYQILNMIAAAHGARQAVPIARAVADFAGPGRATVLVTGAKLGPADAALANCACSMAEDFDDIVWMGHTCHSAVFAPLAVAEHEGRPSEELLLAVVAANEGGGRLGASCFLGPVNRQVGTVLRS